MNPVVQLSSRPAIRLVHLVILALAAAAAGACDSGDPSRRVGPTAPSSAPAGGTATIRGGVVSHDASGSRPVANPTLYGWMETGPTSGHTTGPIESDFTGRFAITMPIGIRLRLQAFSVDRYQPCPVTVDVRGDTTQDVRLITDVRLLGASLPAELLATGPLLSGVVFEQTAGGRQPVADVQMFLDGLGGFDLPVASTRTDANGRFVFCGVNESVTYLSASKTGYRIFEGKVPMAGDTTFDVELSR